MKVRFSHLSLLERRKIERWRQMKLSPDEMARRLGLSYSPEIGQ